MKIMEYVQLGNTDLRVSRLCQGTAFRDLPRADDPRALRVLEYAIDRGITFFDTAIAYGWGGAERVLGRAIKGRRDKLVVCGKVPVRLESGAQVAYARAYVHQQLEESLSRLGTDYLDLYLLHHVDEHTPPAEICATMDALVDMGKVRYWGVSNHSAAQVRALLECGSVAAVEEYYNIAGAHLDAQGRSRTRTFEREMMPLLRSSGMGCLAFSPMDTGLLATALPSDPALRELVAAVDEVAAQLGVPRAAVCVAWVSQQAEISSVLCGAESVEHVEVNASGCVLALPEPVLDLLEEARRRYRSMQRLA